MKLRLILMCGLPGSGKTTRARRLADEVPAIRLCTDEWQAALKVDLTEGNRDSEAFHDLLEAQLWVHAQELIRHGQSIIFEKGLWLRSERDEKRREARELGVDIELHYFDVPVDELARRLEERNAQEPERLLRNQGTGRSVLRDLRAARRSRAGAVSGIDRPPLGDMTKELAPCQATFALPR